MALLSLAERIRRVRDEVAARQVMVTEAIHRELGAVVAPVVKKRMWGPWQIFIAAPFARPAVVERAIAIAHRTPVPRRRELGAPDDRAHAPREFWVTDPRAQPRGPGSGD